MEKDCIQYNIILLDAQNINCPEKVVEEVKRLWNDYELGNDWYYFQFGVDDDFGESNYPVISEYLKSRNITECLIHWWW